MIATNATVIEFRQLIGRTVTVTTHGRRTITGRVHGAYAAQGLKAFRVVLETRVPRSTTATQLTTVNVTDIASYTVA